MLAGGVPPINVLIVEDNPINLKLLEAFVKRLKVRWKTAMNGRDAVKKWKGGGFHLVLMDIQLPIMNGLDATKEIRRLERVNSIGVFSSSASGVFSGSVTSEPEGVEGDIEDKDRLANIELFKSPVIIVALTASSLQSDRHEALAAGCNDFLTKPVNFVWLERKVMEWGCMQALIDFDGWRQWKDFAQDAEENDAAKKAAGVKAKSKKNRLSVTTAAA
ncbi:Response regulator mcs4 like protein [Verticillium longisporum]|nr:Response regulator mcs4 like protein [Verticillium longisporum]